MKELEQILYDAGQIQNLKHNLIKDKDDYFKQAVIIIANMKQDKHTIELAMEIDKIFMKYGYEEYQFIESIAKYFTELEELYKNTTKKDGEDIPVSIILD